MVCALPKKTPLPTSSSWARQFGAKTDQTNHRTMTDGTFLERNNNMSASPINRRSYRDAVVVGKTIKSSGKQTVPPQKIQYDHDFPALSKTPLLSVS